MLKWQRSFGIPTTCGYVSYSSGDNTQVALSSILEWSHPLTLLGMSVSTEISCIKGCTKACFSFQVTLFKKMGLNRNYNISAVASMQLHIRILSVGFTPILVLYTSSCKYLDLIYYPHIKTTKASIKHHLSAMSRILIQSTDLRME